MLRRMRPQWHIWYDQAPDGLLAGDKWWDEILDALALSDIFIYILSNESVNSRYCQAEFEEARRLQKRIITIQARDRTQIAGNLADIQFVDMKNGVNNGLAIANLSGALDRQASMIADLPPLWPERTPKPQDDFQSPSRPPDAPDIDTPVLRAPQPFTPSQAIPLRGPAHIASISPSEAFVLAADAMENGDYGAAIDIIHEALESGPSGRLQRMLQAMLEEAESHRVEEDEAAREYAPIRELVQRPATRELGLREFRLFQQDFPDYDPDNIAAFLPRRRHNLVAIPMISPLMNQVVPKTNAHIVREIIGAPFDWCEIPAGPFIYGDESENNGPIERNLDAFMLAKYPVTYQQFQAFVEAQDGYFDSRWWEGLACLKPDQPYEAEWPFEDHPRERVTWFDAVAFCRWLSWRLGCSYSLDAVDKWGVRLPTEYEWEKAARGQDRRPYPYGPVFDMTRSNTRESGFGQTTPVTKYTGSASPYGVLDMSGNVWEWCLSDKEHPREIAGLENLRADLRRIVRGGSCNFYQYFAQNGFRNDYPPDSVKRDCGFRLCGPAA